MVLNARNRQAETAQSAEPEELAELYLNYRRYAFSIAYRMLGTVSDAEDVVQDCFADLQRRDLTSIDNIKAYVAKSMTNRCLNLLNSAHSRRAVSYTHLTLPTICSV